MGSLLRYSSRRGSGLSSIRLRWIDSIRDVYVDPSRPPQCACGREYLTDLANPEVNSRIAAPTSLCVRSATPRTSVARRGMESYSRAVRHRALPHWAVIFFLVSRLIFGEFAHAMPHASAPVTEETALADNQATPPCPDHTQQTSSTSSDASGPGAANAGDHPMDDKDCCKKGSCECPCLHTPPAAVLTSGPAIMPVNQRCPGVLAIGAAWHRSSALFRPPAQLR